VQRILFVASVDSRAPQLEPDLVGRGRDAPDRGRLFRIYRGI